jgi:hypothetical protein
MLRTSFEFLACLALITVFSTAMAVCMAVGLMGVDIYQGGLLVAEFKDDSLPFTANQFAAVICWIASICGLFTTFGLLAIVDGRIRLAR